MKATILTCVFFSLSLFSFSQSLQEQLGTAIGLGNYEAVQILIKQGASLSDEIPNKLNKFTETPLNSAIRMNKPEIAELLLSLGAKPNQKNKLGLMPIHATATGIIFGKKYKIDGVADSVSADVKCASILVQYKADINAKWVGKSWEQLANEYKHDQLYSYILYIKKKK